MYFRLCSSCSNLSRFTLYANEGRESKTNDSVYNTHLNSRGCFSGKKCIL